MKHRNESNYRARIERRNAPSLQVLARQEAQQPPAQRVAQSNVAIRCGWGRLLFAHTFTDPKTLSDTLREEQPEDRDIALYLRDPHVVLAQAPQELFLDPSHTYRLWLARYRPGRVRPRGFIIRRLQRRSDAEAINRILRARGMVPMDPEFVWKHRDSQVFTYLVAGDPNSGEVIGTVTGVDHERAFDDPENGASLWCLAVDRQAQYPGVGRVLVTALADHYAARGRAFMDLSVMHDNEEAIRLYEDLGFVRVPVFCLKKKNPINEPLFMGPAPGSDLNVYAEIIVNEARRRGIAVDVLDAANGFIVSRHLDDKAGVAVMLALAREVREQGLELPVDCHLLFTITEEVGSGASAVLHGDVAEMVTIDTGPVAVGQSGDEFGVTVCMQDSTGPFDYHLTRKLLELCEIAGVRHKRDVFRYYRCDSASALEAGNDIRTALVCFGTDATHGYERCHVSALEALGRLLGAYVQSEPVARRDGEELGPLSGFTHLPVEPGT